MKTIPIFFSFARSGGTLVNQLLGTHPDCLVLSEVNPAASVVSLAAQASDWMGLIDPDKVEQFDVMPYAQQIGRLDELARSRNKTLVVRDWVTVNYLQGAGGVDITPSGILEQVIYLSREGYALRPLVITRKSTAVYKSIRQNFCQLTNLSAKEFASSYLAYVRAVCKFPRVSLESIQTDPSEALQRILQTFSVSTDHMEEQLAKFADFRRCTGNNTLALPAATSYLRRIVPINCDPLSTEIPEFAEADCLLGYES